MDEALGSKSPLPALKYSMLSEMSHPTMLGVAMQRAIEGDRIMIRAGSYFEGSLVAIAYALFIPAATLLLGELARLNDFRDESWNMRVGHISQAVAVWLRHNQMEERMNQWRAKYRVATTL